MGIECPAQASSRPADEMNLHDFHIPEDVQSFMRCMRIADGWSTEDLFDFMEKPWHWEREFELWENAKKPGPDDDNFAIFTRWLLDENQ